MPKLRNKKTGVVVNVDDVTAARLGSEWRPADQKPVTAKRATPTADK